MIDEREEYILDTGKVVAGEELDQLSEELATREIDIKDARPRGRPLLGEAPAKAVQVRLDPDLAAKLLARAEHDHTTSSDIMRQALSQYLAS
jgi:hypothetical protein